jgi:hypothetical protein
VGQRRDCKSRGVYFFLWQRAEKSSIGNRIFCTPENSMSNQESGVVRDSMSHIVLRGRWCNIIVLNAHAPTQEKGDDSKDSFYEELEGVFDHSPKYHMKILLGDFNAEVGREDTFQPTIGNESLHRIVVIMVLK